MAKRKQYVPGQSFQPPVNDDVAFLLGGGESTEQVEQCARERGLPLTHVPVEAIAPDMNQLRRLPHPSDLTRMAEEGDQGSTVMLEGLRELGESIKEHGQLQPVIVYQDEDPDNPTITHRLLNGQRRWSAALLVGVPTLWAVEVPRPSEVVRLLHQYEENERREGFSDMERAWACVSLKDALQQEAGGEVPWGVVEEQIHLSTQRRQDLLRLMRFSTEGQAIILRYGWSEWVLRPLHMAIQAGTVDQDTATTILRQLAASDRVTTATVTEAVRAHHQPTRKPAPNTIAVLRKATRLRQSVAQLGSQIADVADHEARAAMIHELTTMKDDLIALLNQFGSEEPRSFEPGSEGEDRTSTSEA